MQRKDLGRLPRNVWIMSATSLLNDISSEMLLNLIPFFLANILGVRTSVIGLIDGIAETTASLMKVFFGALSDRYGKRKPFAVAGYALSAFTKPLLYFATAWGWVLGVRVADRIGKGIRTAPRDALIAEVADVLPAGWGCETSDQTAWPNLACRTDLWAWCATLFGWTISVLAIMLGAPFWFGVLQRASEIRGSGPKPPPARDDVKA